MKSKIILLLSFFICWQVSGQKLFYQDIFHGGVTRRGFNPALSPTNSK